MALFFPRACQFIWHPIIVYPPFLLQSGDPVWIRASSGDWQSGVVSGQVRIGQTRQVSRFRATALLPLTHLPTQKEGLFYPVIYGDKVRKYFAPQNGEIKPDTPQTRRLLEEAGWL